MAVEGNDDGNKNLELNLFGILKLVRLLRLGRILRYLKFKQGLKIGLRMVELLFFLLMLVHWIACGWFFLVKTPGSWVPPRDLDYPSRNTTEGAALWGLSLALHEGAEFEQGQVKQRNLDSYKPLRMSDVPELDIEFIDSDEFPSGLGEPPLIPVAPAIGNAVFTATGRRLRDLPMRLS